LESVIDGCRTVTFVVEEKNHPRFERVDDDLIIRLNLTLSQALLGPEGGGSISKEVEQLDGRRIHVSLPEGVGGFASPNLSHYSRSNFCTAGCPTQPGNSSSRGGHACVKGGIREEERRSCCEVECGVPGASQSCTKAGVTKSIGIG
jgi:DnaJ family protein B protein 4